MLTHSNISIDNELGKRIILVSVTPIAHTTRNSFGESINRVFTLVNCHNVLLEEKYVPLQYGVEDHS